MTVYHIIEFFCVIGLFVVTYLIYDWNKNYQLGSQEEQISEEKSVKFVPRHPPTPVGQTGIEPWNTKQDETKS